MTGLGSLHLLVAVWRSSQTPVFFLRMAFAFQAALKVSLGIYSLLTSADFLHVRKKFKCGRNLWVLSNIDAFTTRLFKNPNRLLHPFYTSSLCVVLLNAVHSSGEGRVNKTMLLPLEI